MLRINRESSSAQAYLGTEKKLWKKKKNSKKKLFTKCLKKIEKLMISYALILNVGYKKVECQSKVLNKQCFH